MIAGLLLWAGASAAADGLRRPVRLTAGSSDQFLGTLSSDGRQLLYVSDEHATLQIFSRQLPGGAATPLFDEAADVTWPRLSPDGRWVAYLSHRRDAAGDVCLRPLAGGAPRCLSDARTAELHLQWMPDGRGLAVLSRAGLHDDLVLERVPLKGGKAQPLVAGNLSSPALSPDARWVAYVPIARGVPQIGVQFAVRAARHLELRLLDRQGAPPLRVELKLPGLSGFPAFSRDGRWLYFAQYLNDTNRDGAIDAEDNGVLFRVAFDAAAKEPISAASRAQPEQLSSASWDCADPSPAGDRLIATCAVGGGPRDVYALPLDGIAPRAWPVAKLEDERAASRDRWERLLLLSHLVARAPDPVHRRRLVGEMVRLHLGLSELESADFYARQLDAADLGAERAGAPPALRELVAHRRAERSLDRGQVSAAFIGEARARLARLQALDKDASPGEQVLGAITASEIHETLGELERARVLLEQVVPAELEDPLRLHLFAGRARSLYRRLDERQALLQVFRGLAAHPALDEAERLGYAGAFATELLRGRPNAARSAMIEAARATVDPDSELALVLEARARLQGLSRQSEEAVRAALFDLYRRTRSGPRRRVLMEEIVGTAARRDNAYLLYEFANTWVSGLRRDQAERRLGEELFRRVVLERAYLSGAEGNVADARGFFYGVTLQTDSLEAHLGFIDARLREGKRDLEALYRKRYAREPEAAVYHFVRAYLAARELPELRDVLEHAGRAELAEGHLRTAARELSDRPELQQLWAWVGHQRFLRTGASTEAEAANTRYLLALDLAVGHPRLQASVLAALGMLQTAVGNYALALEHLEARARLPFGDPAAELAHRLARARCLLHLDRDQEAAAEAELALGLVETHSELERFAPLALDRAALTHLSAGEASPARARYAQLLARLKGATAPTEPGDRIEMTRNRIAAHLGRASAALSLADPAATLVDLARAESLRSALPAPPPPGTDPGEKGGVAAAAASQARRTLPLILSGLRAEAQRALGDHQGAAAALVQRRSLLEARLAADRLDEDRLELVLVETRLAEVAATRGALAQARRHLEAGLRHLDAFRAATGTEVHQAGLDLLMAAAELHLDLGEPLAAFSVDLKARLRETHSTLCARRNPDWEPARRRLELYLILLDLPTQAIKPSASLSAPLSRTEGAVGPNTEEGA